MVQGVAIIVVVFLCGFGMGFGFRAWMSHRRRERIRRERNFGMPDIA